MVGLISIASGHLSTSTDNFYNSGIIEHHKANLPAKH